MESTEIVDNIGKINIQQDDNNKDIDPNRNDVEPDAEHVAKVLAHETLEVIHPRLMNVKPQLKELIQKQNKILLDISAEKFKYSRSNVDNVENMIQRVKFYRDKLIRIRRLMIDIHHKSKSLRTRAENLQKQAEIRSRKSKGLFS